VWRERGARGSIWRGFGPRQAKKGSRLREDVTQAIKSAVQGDKIEEIAMLSGGCVGPFANSALASIRSRKPDEQAAAGRIFDVADEPVISGLATVGEIMAAHRWRLARKMARQFGGRTLHKRAPEKKGPA
jgi:hypothetical protein